MFGPQLSAADAVALEDAVAPRYLSQFTSLLLDMMLPYDAARIVNLGSWHGYPDALVAEKMPGGKLVGVTSSLAAMETARAKAASLSGVEASYLVHEGALPLPLSEDGFTHAFALHPTCRREERQALTSELRRLLVPGGQAMIALPLRGSFAELSDMGRECALKQDLTNLNAALDTALAARPTPEAKAEACDLLLC